MTSGAFAEMAGWGIIFGSRNSSGFVCAMTNFIWAGSVKVLKVVGIARDVVVEFDNLSACSMTSRNSGERFCCKSEGCSEAGGDILCFCNLPIRLMTSRDSKERMRCKPKGREEAVEVILGFDNLSACLMKSRRSEERICCKL